ncbi:glycosyltransferase family 4 protein [Shewanella fidelis]|uniref:glycosyltransferase family 4 protein n=1 Tax=Shewanella fidelis TaxID=173509 RepID=UPI0004919688|nr:glycosyltransferase family 4 protein [Shewanella fidelis]
MLVAHFVYNFWNYSGATAQAVKLADSLNSTSDVKSIFFNNTVNSLKWYRESVVEDKIVIDLPNNLLLKLFSILATNKKYNPDVYHFHGFHRLGLILTVLLNIPTFFKCTLLGKDDFPSLLKGRNRSLTYFILARIGKINCLNRVIQDLNYECIPDANLEIIPNGVVMPVDVERSLYNQKKKFFLFAGAIVERKQPLEVIRFFNDNYASQGYNLILAGPHDSSVAEFEQDYFELCKAESQRFNSEQIQFVGNVESSRLKKYYAQSTGLIFFSLREGTPNVVLEAMSWDCPVIFLKRDVIVADLIGYELSVTLSLDNFDSPGPEPEMLLSIARDGLASQRARLFDIDQTAVKHYTLYLEMLKT